MTRPRLLVSFSGGRTSAFMSIWIKQNLAATHDLVFIFANTSSEHPDTLRFVNEVDRRFNLGLVWVETVVHLGSKIGSTHRVVTFDTASRSNERYEAVCEKYGLPNVTYGHCTRELKLQPIWSYCKSIGWNKGSYTTAIGIRADEQRRVSKNADTQHLLYPLIDMVSTDKQDVLAYFEDFDWDLKIPEHQGNCVTCFKKSDTKLNALYKENPGNFDFAIRMEDLYKTVGPNTSAAPRAMFRGRRSARQLVAQFAGLDFDSSRHVSEGGCSESCELFPTEVNP